MNAKITAPAGKSGLAVEPWSKGEVYAVAANWAQASDPVLTYGENGWTSSQWQVADFGHNMYAALESQIREAIAMSEGISPDDVDDDEVGGIAEDATELMDAAK